MPCQCQYCKKMYSTRYALKIHQERTKACLKLREDTAESTSNLTKFECDDCSSDFSSKHAYEYHKTICLKYNIRLLREEYDKRLVDKDKECNDKIKVIIEQKDKENLKLETTVKDQNIRIKEITELLANKPTVVNNNTMKNTNTNTFNIAQFFKDVNKPLTDKQLTDSVPKLRFHHCVQGGKGFAEYASDYALENVALLCTDVSRNKFQYEEEFNGKKVHIIDPELIQFNPKFFKIIKDAVTNFLTPHMNELIETGEDQNMEKSTQMAMIINNVNNASLGKSNNLTDEFVKCLAPRCVPNLIEKRLTITQ